MYMSRATKKCKSAREVKAKAMVVQHFKEDAVLKMTQLFIENIKSFSNSVKWSSRT